MTALHSFTIAPSEQLLAPLREVRMRRWTVVSARAILKTLTFWLLVLLGSSLLLGYFWLPAFVRVGVALGSWSLILWWTWRSLRPALRWWTLSQAAQHVERTLPHMDERLSSAVELTSGRDLPAFRGSPELVAHLVRLAEADASALNPSVLVPLD